MSSIQLSRHFTLDDLTVTNREELQEMNRIVTEQQIQKLRYVAGLVEVAAEILGENFSQPFTPKIHSAYRCEALNLAVGSNERSQHLKCEAVDLIFAGLDLGECFRILWKRNKAGTFPFGQMIHETAERSYGETSWIHLSLGMPWRPTERCNQVLRMEHGKYELLS